MSWDEHSVIVLNPLTLQEVGRLSSPGLLVRQIALAGDGRRLALGDWKGNVDLWDLEVRQRITSFVVGSGSISHLQFSRNGDRLLCIGERGDGKRVLQLYETASWSAVDFQGIGLEELRRAILAPSGRTLAVANRGGTVTWWDLKTKNRQALFHWQHLGVQIPMAFSPDGRWFAAGGESSVLMLVEVASRQTRPITRAHLNQVNALAFSPDGRRLITSGTAGNDTLKVWDVESGRDIAMMGGKPGFYDHVGFSPDGNTLYAVGGMGTVLLWRAPSFEEIAAQAQAGARSP